MIVSVHGVFYETDYYPFFRIKILDDHTVFGLKLPSGNIEKIKIYDQDNWYKSLLDYSGFLITEYMLEDDLVLTDRAKELKQDLMELFRHADN